MALFDLVNFNGEVFDAAVCNTPNLRLNELLKSGAIVEHSEYAAMLPDVGDGSIGGTEVFLYNIAESNKVAIQYGKQAWKA